MSRARTESSASGAAICSAVRSFVGPAICATVGTSVSYTLNPAAPPSAGPRLHHLRPSAPPSAPPSVTPSTPAAPPSAEPSAHHQPPRLRPPSEPLPGTPRPPLSALPSAPPSRTPAIPSAPPSADLEVYTLAGILCVDSLIDPPVRRCLPYSGPGTPLRNLAPEMTLSTCRTPRIPDRRGSYANSWELVQAPSAIRARDVRAADLQEEPTKRLENRAHLRHSRFVGFDEDGGSRRTSQRAERAIRQSERWRARQSNL